MNIIYPFKSIGRKILYYPGWKTSRKIIVIESDDWGSASIPSREVYKQLLRAGITVNKDPYCKFDGLAEPEDLKKLFDVLTSYEDQKGRHPVITANTIVANPDYSKIRASNFEEYYYERFTETLKGKKETESSFDLWIEGISKRIFIPQFHGREHLHVSDWMHALQLGNKQVLDAFNLDTYAIPVSENKHRKRDDFRAAFDCSSKKQLEELKGIVREGVNIFEEIFDYRADAVIAPCYIWMKELESTLHEMGITLIQGIAFQTEPVFGHNSYKKTFNYLGKRNRTGQYYSVRNVFFEPTLYPTTDLIKRTMRRIKEAFNMNKPAIICSHRLNYIGSMSKEKQDNNLALLSELLAAIDKQWQDVEYMSSSELRKIMANEL